MNSSSKIEKVVQGTQVTISEVNFIDSCRLSLKINDSLYLYKKTKVYKNTIYFQCNNRFKGSTTHKKCLARAHFDSSTKSLDILDLHNANCSTRTQNELIVNTDYLSQRDDIRETLSQNETIGVTATMNILRDKNLKASPESKRLPLKYDQVKKIIKDYKEENNLSSQISSDISYNLKTTDGAMFRRCHNKYDLIYKGIF